MLWELIKSFQSFIAETHSFPPQQQFLLFFSLSMSRSDIIFFLCSLFDTKQQRPTKTTTVAGPLIMSVGREKEIPSQRLWQINMSCSVELSSTMTKYKMCFPRASPASSCVWMCNKTDLDTRLFNFISVWKLFKFIHSLFHELGGGDERQIAMKTAKLSFALAIVPEESKPIPHNNRITSWSSPGMAHNN